MSGYEGRHVSLKKTSDIKFEYMWDKLSKSEVVAIPQPVHKSQHLNIYNNDLRQTMNVSGTSYRFHVFV